MEESAAYCIHRLLNTPRENTETRSDLFVYARSTWQPESVTKAMVRATVTEPDDVQADPEGEEGDAGDRDALQDEPQRASNGR